MASTSSYLLEVKILHAYNQCLSISKVQFNLPLLVKDPGGIIRTSRSLLVATCLLTYPRLGGLDSAGGSGSGSEEVTPGVLG